MGTDRQLSDWKPEVRLGLFIILLTTFSSFELSGQSEQRCLFNDGEINRSIASLQRASSTDIGQSVNIPIVIHIVYHTLEQNISNEKIMSQLNTLNEDFNRKNTDSVNTLPEFKPRAANAKLNFILAPQDENGNASSGITRTQTQHGPFFDDDIHYTNQGGKDAWLSSRFLNIWVCDLPEGVFGFGMPPGSELKEDGVVIDFSHFDGNNSGMSFGKGRTITHEVGHWLGLKHLWGNIGGCVDDDGIEDTPMQSGPSAGCDLTRNSCGNLNMVQNFMDLSSDDCLNLFTKGQVKQMRKNLFELRSGNISEDVTTRTIEAKPHLEPSQIDRGRFIINSRTPIEDVKILDMTGREIFSNFFSGLGRNEAVIDLANQKGVFIILISTGASRHSIKLATLN